MDDLGCLKGKTHVFEYIIKKKEFFLLPSKH